MNQKRDKVDPAIQRVLEVAGLKAKLSHATGQTQAVINTLVKYSEALGRVMQCGRAVVDAFDGVVEKHGPCPDEGLAAHVGELKKVVYDLLPKGGEDQDVEEPEAPGEGEPGRRPDGGVDAPPAGEAPEGDPADDGAQAPGAPAPEEAAPAQPGR